MTTGNNVPLAWLVTFALLAGAACPAVVMYPGWHSWVLLAGSLLATIGVGREVQGRMREPEGVERAEGEG